MGVPESVAKVPIAQLNLDNIVSILAHLHRIHSWLHGCLSMLESCHRLRGFDGVYEGVRLSTLVFQLERLSDLLGLEVLTACQLQW